jgi:hypothetical protein
MYKIVLVAAVIFLANCNNQKTQENMKDKPVHADKQALVLDNGSKWKLDSNTRVNISEMKELLKEPASQNMDWKRKAEELAKKTDEIVKECRMQGKGHDELHAWLEGFIAHRKHLETGETGKKEAYLDLQGDMEILDRYFE